jgi:hypothetical protein
LTGIPPTLWPWTTGKTLICWASVGQRATLLAETIVSAGAAPAAILTHLKVSVLKPQSATAAQLSQVWKRSQAVGAPQALLRLQTGPVAGVLTGAAVFVDVAVGVVGFFTTGAGFFTAGAGFFTAGAVTGFLTGGAAVAGFFPAGAVTGAVVGFLTGGAAATGFFATGATTGATLGLAATGFAATGFATTGFAATLGLAVEPVTARFPSPGRSFEATAISGKSAVKSSRLNDAGSITAPAEDAMGAHDIMGVKVMAPKKIGRKCIAKKSYSKK